MEIKEKSRDNLTKQDLYNLITAPDAKKLSEMEDQEVTIVDWVICTDVNQSTGEMVDLLNILDNNGQVYATNSPTVIRTFKDIINCFGRDFNTIKVFSGTSNRGRKYFMCKYVK